MLYWITVTEEANEFDQEEETEYAVSAGSEDEAHSKAHADARENDLDVASTYFNGMVTKAEAAERDMWEI